MNEVLSAVAAYLLKKTDVELLVQSMHKCPENHPGRVLRLNTLAIELADELKVINQMLTSSKVGVIGREL